MANVHYKDTGIDFAAHADSSATGASTDAELLNDYEEGTWTPEDGTSNWASSSTIGEYVRVGNLVHISCTIQFSSTSGGQMSIENIPFVCRDPSVSSATQHGSNAGTDAHFRLNDGSSKMILHGAESGAAIASDEFDGTHMIWNMHYRTS